MDGRRARIWFEAKRAIEVGEELTFSYTDEPVALYLWEIAGGFRLLWLLMLAAAIVRGDRMSDWVSRDLWYPAAGVLITSATISFGSLIGNWAVAFCKT